MESILIPPIHIGVDIGKLRDPSAISVVEVVQAQTGRYRPCTRVIGHFRGTEWISPRDADPVMMTRYIIRQIGRLPLGTSYPDVALKIVNLLLSDKFVGRILRLFIDVTGVGQAIFDDVKREIEQRSKELSGEKAHRLKCLTIQPISFVHGEKYNRTKGTLGKAFLVSRMQSLLQNDKVDAPDTQEMRATCEELLVYEIKISQEGKDTYGSFKTGTHDDLATALALSCLEDPYALQASLGERWY